MEKFGKVIGKSLQRGKPPDDQSQSSSSARCIDNVNQLKNQEYLSIVAKAVASAKKHGISLVQGRCNPAVGDCAFESVIFNNNDRNCFTEKLNFSTDYYRRVWMNDLQAKFLDNPTWNLGYTIAQLKAGFEEMKEPGVYERGLFGDLLLPAISVGTHKHILIFNTHENSPHDPISVISPSSFGGFHDTEIPIILAYNMVHFESMHPKSHEDIMRSVELIDAYVNGRYGFKRSDIPMLIQTEKEDMIIDKEINLAEESDNSSFQFKSNGISYEITMDENGFMECPICRKKFQRLRPHLKSKKDCSALVDFESFNASFERFDKDFKKSKERERKADFRKRKLNSKETDQTPDSVQLNSGQRPGRDEGEPKLVKLKKKDMTPEQLKEYNRNCHKKRIAAMKDKETEEGKTQRLAKKKKEYVDRRQKETNKEADNRREKERKSKVKQRQKETKEEATLRKLKEKLARERARLLAKSRPKNMYAGRNAQKVLYGEQIVPELKDTDDKIGSMIHVCSHCSALKWNKETSTLCCTNGKISLTPFPSPPDYLQNLWTADTAEARLFRENARSFNNALALSSIVVTERKFESNYSPSVVFEGKVCQMYGPLEADKNEVPRFAQLYIHDPATQHTMRLKNMNLPSSLNKKQTTLIVSVMKKLQNLMGEVNPYVKDFQHICEIPDKDIKDGKLVISCKEKPKHAHERTYNLQQSFSEVSVLTNSEPGDLVLRKRGGGLQFVYDIHPSAQPLHFTLLFPFGTKGYDESSRHAKGNTSRRVTPREFFAFHINMRDHSQDFLFRAGRLFQEYLCLAFTTIQNQKLKFHKNNQKALRADTYKNVKEVMSERVPMTDKVYDDDHKLKIGKRVVLSGSFPGSPRWYNAQFQDGMAICREYHKPDFFITMTCNPNWEEIKCELRVGEKAQDRPDLVARVFKQKKDQLIKDISSEKVFGKVPAYLWVIEFQKRGLPHTHILVILADEDRVSSAEDVDNVICAELPPDPDTFPVDSDQRKQALRLQTIVLKNMIHGPCGKNNPDSPCMTDGKCSKRYPKAFCDKTTLDPDNTYPEYRRLAPEKGGRTLVVTVNGKEFVIDNSWVVPYSPFLSLRFNCHINDELCLSPTGAKYLYKYAYKGEDRAMVRAEIGDESANKDEISDFVDMRSIGSSEAAWQILNFNITKKHPAVYALRCHLEDENHVVFDNETAETAIEQQRNTELTGFFEYNDQNPETRIKYVDFPKKFVWKDKTWRERKSAFDTIGRVHSINPAAGDVFFLRMLLHHDHSRGKTSFQDLKMVGGESCETYQEVCRLLGLLQDDKEWDEALTEGSITKLCPALRELYTTILLFSMPSNPRELFENHYLEWADDFKQRAEKNGFSLTEEQLKTLILVDINTRLQSWEKTLMTFGLHQPTPEELDDANFDSKLDTPTLIREELNFDLEELGKLIDDRLSNFTESQRDVFETTMRSVYDENPLALFIDARGGTGKTYVLNAILAAVRIIEQAKGGSIALAVGTTGKAANLLQLGRTFHSRFKAPLSPQEDSFLSINKQSTLAELIRRAKIIVMDEAPMLHRYQLEALDRSLQDLMDRNTPFGGKILILSGDFRQCLPVIPGAGSATVIDAALNRSPLWKFFKVMPLVENMRIRSSGNALLQEFDDWTLSIGNGNAEMIDGSDLIEIPEDMCMEISQKTFKDPDSESRAMQKLADHVYPSLSKNFMKPGWMDGRAILAPTNKQVDSINNLIADTFPGEPIIMTSSDELVNADDLQRFNIEYLNTLDPSGLPTHRLFLKPGMPIMLIRNLNPKMGLCNGTKLIFHKVHKNHLLECVIAGGEFNNRKVLIPRISFKPKEREFTFEWSRRQFPVRVCFAMTINKSQGQTLQNVGVWLNDSCFAHGQLYVAISRVGSPSNIKFAIRKIHGSSWNHTSNVVFKEVFRNIQSN